MKHMLTSLVIMSPMKYLVLIIIIVKDVTANLYIDVHPYGFSTLNDNTGKNYNRENDKEINVRGPTFSRGAIYCSYSISYNTFNDKDEDALYYSSINNLISKYDEIYSSA